MVDPKKEPFASLPHVGPENIESQSGRLKDVRTAAECGLISSKYEFDERAIVYSKIRPNLNKVAFPRFRGISSADAYPIWVIDGLMLPEYLAHVLRSSDFVKQAVAVSARTGMPKINRADLACLMVPVPSIEDQRRIAACLTDIDRMSEIVGDLRDAQLQLRSGLLQTLLTGRRRFSTLATVAWSHTQLGELASIAFSGIDKKTTLGETRIHLCNYMDVLNNARITPRLDFMAATVSDHERSRFSLEIGDIVMTKDSETAEDIARVALVAEPLPGVVLGYHLALIRCRTHDIDPRYLYWALQAPATRAHFVSHSVGVVRSALTIPAVRTAPILLPQLQEQLKIADALDTADLEVDGLNRLGAELRHQRTAVMNRLLVESNS